MNSFSVIKGSVTTEKSTMERVQKHVYSFFVSSDATKTEVKNSVEKLFNVKVSAVKTLRYDGKKKRVGKFVGKKPSFKKAYVKLVEGNVISQFEGI